MNIVITSKNGYISRRLDGWLSYKNGQLQVERVSIRNNSLASVDLTNCNCVIHTAALVHKKESNYSKKDYLETNRDLTIKLANKAKENGVRHFLLLSTMSVFGVEGSVTEKRIIDSRTPLSPQTFYGESKLGAEEALLNMQTEDFKVAILRPPMVYGPGCPGNYKLLSKLARKTPIFPDIQNERSMIFIDNLCEFIRVVIERRLSGIFHPQDQEYVCTSQMVKEIARVHGKRVQLDKVSGAVVKNGLRKQAIVNKVFGNLTYAPELSSFELDYHVCGMREAIRRSEKGE